MNKKILLSIALVLIVGGIIYLEKQKPVGKAPQDIATPATQSRKQETQYERAKEIVDPSGFINTKPFKLADIVGKKIILLDFWTYSCINCQRTTPYLNAWYEKYHSKGLEIVGIHTPEFSFEKNYENVAANVQKMGIKYPVVLDNNSATWDAYQNRFWPNEYLIDKDGFIVYEHAGEGNYDVTEHKIQELLGEIAQTQTAPKGVIDVNFQEVKSPETYFGAMRNEFLANGKQNVEGLQTFSTQKIIEPNQLYLEGDWDIQHEFAQNKSKDAKIIFRYQAKNVYIVASARKPTTVLVIQDGKPQAPITINAEKLYPVIQGKDYGDHTLELILSQPDFSAFTLTFG